MAALYHRVNRMLLHSHVKNIFPSHQLTATLATGRGCQTASRALCGLAAGDLPQSAANSITRPLPRRHCCHHHHGFPSQCLGRALIEFLDRNDRQYPELLKRWHRTVSGRSSSEVREIVQAARQNTSVKRVAVVPTKMGNDKADKVASVIQSLRGIEEFHIETTSTVYAEDRFFPMLKRMTGFSTESFTTKAVS